MMEVISKYIYHIIILRELALEKNHMIIQMFSAYFRYFFNIAIIGSCYINKNDTRLILNIVESISLVILIIM